MTDRTLGLISKTTDSVTTELSHKQTCVTERGHESELLHFLLDLKGLYKYYIKFTFMLVG